MQRYELEHVIRAASGITGAPEIVIIGSQAVLGQFPDAPEVLRMSRELDVFTLRSPEDAELIDGTIGELSPFHQTFGYYAHGVARETAILPQGWESRLIRVQNENTGTGAGLCLEVHDLAVREKDLEFVQALLTEGLAEAAVIEQRLPITPLPPARLSSAQERLQRMRSRKSQRG